MAGALGQFGDGEAYERLMGRWSRVAGEGFLDWLDLSGGLQWLDVGCGNGAFTEAIVVRSDAAQVVAIDPSEGQVDYARARPGAKGAEFRLGNAQALSFADASFDVAAMALAITFVPDPAKAVSEMVRVVRPGGWVATYMWDIPGGGLPLEPINVAMRSLGMPFGSPPSAAASRRDAMQALWENAGLEAIEATVIRIPTVYSDFDDFWSSNSLPVGPTGQALAALSSSARDQLQAHLRQQLPVRPDGSIALEAFANAVKGRVPALAT